MRKQLNLIIKADLQDDILPELKSSFKENLTEMMKNQLQTVRTLHYMNYCKDLEINQIFHFLTDKCDSVTLRNLEKRAFLLYRNNIKYRKLLRSHFMLQLKYTQLKRLDKDLVRLMGELGLLNVKYQ